MEQDFDVIYGKNTILEALSSGQREINKIIISKNIHSDNKIDKIKEIAKSNRIIYQFVGKEKFIPYDKFNHQGVIAKVAPIKYMDIEDFIEKFNNLNRTACVVVLDGIEDSHNLGAIIRSCVCAGVDGIIIPARRNVLVDGVVDKISQGAINHIPIIKVNSLITTLEKLKNNNWWIISTDASANDNYFDIDYTDMNYALVMGAEHAGVSKSVLKASDYIIKIPMQNNFNSLNVSNAMSVIIFEALKQKLVKKE